MRVEKRITPSGQLPSKIMLVGDCPNAEELASNAPFSGYTQAELSKMMFSAGIPLQSTYRTHVVKFSPVGGDASALMALKKMEITDKHEEYKGKWVLPSMIKAIEQLKHEIEMCQPNVIIALGNIALWALTSHFSVHQYRSSLLQCDLKLNLDYKPKVIPTYPCATINRMWEWRFIAVHDLKRAKRESETKELYIREKKFEIKPTFELASHRLKWIYAQLEYLGKKDFKIACDIETKHQHIECIALAWSEVDAICIPFTVYPEARHYWNEEEEIELVQYLYKILTHKNIILIGQNFSYDDQYIWRRLHFNCNVTRDTMLTQHGLFSTSRKTLDFISSMYVPDYVYWKDERHDSVKEERWNYNCKDAVATYECDTAQQQVVDMMGMRIPVDFQNTQYKHIQRIMRKGIGWDKELAVEIDRELIGLIQEREEYIRECLGFLPNIASPPQMSDLFYRLLGQSKKYNRKTGSVSCDDEALTKIAEKEPILYPITVRISEIRSITKLLDITRVKLYENTRFLNSYNIGGTDTYRYSSSSNAFEEGANSQNLSDGTRSTIALPNMRKLLIPDEGMTYFDSDYDSADLRIVAAEADEQEIFAMLNEGKKVYVEVMKEYFKNPNMTKNDPFYVKFKALCHGSNYLGTSSGLAKQIGLLIHEVEVIQKWYFGKFPKIKTWQDSVKDQAFKRQMVQNIFGNRLYIFKRIEGTVLNEVIAWIPQSTIALLVDRALVALCEQFPDKGDSKQFDVLQQNHDSLAGQFETGKEDIYLPAIKKAMEITLPFDKPIVIPSDVHTSTISWGHCK